MIVVGKGKRGPRVHTAKAERNWELCATHVLHPHVSNAELGRRYGITRERVRQLLHRWTPDLDR